MYKIFGVLGILLFSLNGIAQNNFEGKINYSMSFSNDKEITYVEALFGDQKIKVLVKQSTSKSNNKEDLILDFKNGIIYKIINGNKTYLIDSLKKSRGDLFESPKSLVPLTNKDTIILGYKSSAFNLPVSEKAESVSEKIRATLYYADSLLYQIPEKYASFEMVPLFTNGTSVGFGVNMMIDQTENKKIGSEFSILSVEPQNIPDSLLEIPAGYKMVADNSFLDGDQPMADSIQMEADTIAYPAPPLKPGIKDSKKTPQKKPIPNKKAINNTPKTPVRKPNN